MLTLFTGTNAVPLKADDYYIKRLWSGYDEIVFNMSIWDDDYTLLQEEASIREESDDGPRNYLVKAIDGGGNTATIKAQLDLDEWRASLSIPYNSGSNSVGTIISAVAPAGWTVQNASGLTFLRTITLDSATPLGVCEACRETFGVTFRWDNVLRVVKIINPKTYTSMGAFATRDLNLKESNYKGKSTGFATRLYAVGKDGLTFASINGGKAYVDNNTYSDRVICAYWSDDRYTVAETLLADATAKIAEMATPQRSFDCNVIDLANTNPEKYGFLDFSLFNVVSLIDPTRSDTKIDHQVTEVWHYPYFPEQNKVVLSTTAPRIQSQVAQISQSINNPNSPWSQAQAAAVNTATQLITGALGGHYIQTYDNTTGKPDGWAILIGGDTIDTATKVWRMNAGGFGYSATGWAGPYTTAITADGAIVADFITTGTLNAAELTVINLVATNVQMTGNFTSLSGPYTLNMWAAVLALYHDTRLRSILYTSSGSTDTSTGVFQLFRGNTDASGNLLDAAARRLSLDPSGVYVGQDSAGNYYGQVRTKDVYATGAINADGVYCERIRPNSGQNTLYTNWVLVNGSDGNDYYALCGRGTPW